MTFSVQHGGIPVSQCSRKRAQKSQNGPAARRAGRLGCRLCLAAGPAGCLWLPWFPLRRPEIPAHPIIPRAVVSQFDNVIADLELLPRRMNESKKDKMGARQRALSRELRQAGLLRH